jgi:hypothetical protein
MTTWLVRVDGSDMLSFCLRGFVRAKLRTARDSIIFEHRFRSEDLDTSNYEQIHMSREALGDSVGSPSLRAKRPDP